MARKAVKSNAASKSDAADNADAAELAILHPDRKVVIGDTELTLREYRWAEGMEVRLVGRPLFTDLFALYAEDGKAPALEQIEHVMAKHSKLVVWLIAKSADVTEAQIEELSDQDGALVAMNWWVANTGFFIRRVMPSIATESGVARGGASDGLASTSA